MTPPAVLLVTSNGTGMGHLARLVAVAEAAAPGSDAAVLQPVLLSMSTALPAVLAATGLPGEYCPGPTRGWLPVERWHPYLAERVVALVRETGARALVFDGVSPYTGLLEARRRLPDVVFVWSRRGLWQPRASRAPLRAAGSFDLVVEPGDLAAAADAGATSGRTDAARVGPVTLLETEPRLPRAPAAAALGLDADRPTLLVTLGAGDLDDPSSRSVSAVRAGLDAGWQVALTRSAIAVSTLPPDLVRRVVELPAVFPLVRYLDAFDAAASSAGYNAVHELVLGQLPTLLVPSTLTSADDQAVRAAYVGRRGWALVADGPSAVMGAVRRLLREDTRTGLRAATAGLPAPRGAAETVALVLRQLGAGPPQTASGLDPYRPLRQGSLLLRRAVGEQGWERARRAAGAPPRRLGEGPGPVVETAGPLPEGSRRLVFTDDPGDVAAHPDAVVEQVLAGSSDSYRDARRALVARAYDVRPEPVGDGP